MSDNNSLIVISQFPVIQDQLRALQESWEQKAADAAAMVCTEDTVQDIKKIRADMRKEFDEADKLRKTVKEKYMEPWNAVEDTFKVCIKDAFTRADTSLKNTITGFEDEIKEKCKAELEAYCKELCSMDGIDFISFDDAMRTAGIKISLGDAKRATPRQAMDQLGKFVSSVSLGMDQISKMDDAPAIMAEFKKCLDVGQAVSTVQERKRREAAEIEAAEARKRAQEAQAAAVAKVDAAAPQAPITAPVAAPAKPAKSPDDVFAQFTFTIYGATRAQLLKLRDYLNREGLQYK